jgi:hypothetical protein
MITKKRKNLPVSIRIKTQVGRILKKPKEMAIKSPTKGNHAKAEENRST